MDERSGGATGTAPGLVTFGHGTADQQQLTALLRAASVRRLVDVRRFPGSRRHPHTATDELARWLPAAGIDYRWEPRLGGRRRIPAEQVAEDPWWRVEAFRAYAAHTRSDEFRAAMSQLLRAVRAVASGDADTDPDAAAGSVAVMCSESLVVALPPAAHRRRSRAPAPRAGGPPRPRRRPACARARRGRPDHARRPAL